MTDLQLGLIVAGVIIVLVVYGFNRWQEFRYRKTAARAFAKNHPDVLLDIPKNMVRQGVEQEHPQRYEPSFVEPQVDESEAEDDTGPALDSQYALPADPDPQAAELPSSGSPLKAPSIDSSALPAQETARAAAKNEFKSAHTPRFRSSEADRDISLDPAFYFIAEVYTSSPIDAATMPILSAAKRIRCLGLRADKQWEVVTDGSLGQYYELKIGLQLVDRQGPVTQEDINAFMQTVQIFADECEASAVFSQRLQKAQMAQELDQFCAETDVQVGLNLNAKSDLSLEKIARFAEQENMHLSADGAFHLTDESGNTQLSLVNQDGKHFRPTLQGETRAISFLLDVPRVANGAEVFDHMCRLAQHLADELGADLVDDNQQPLTEQSLAIIRRELVQMQNRMQARGIAPGSAIALQLYA